MLSSPSSREGGEEGEEGVTAAKGLDEVAATVEDNDVKPIEVISVTKSPPR
jgi:hypothetical protein